MVTETTERGFRVYARVSTCHDGVVRVQDSSEIGEGPRVWLFLDEEKGCEHLGQHMKPDIYLDEAGVRALRQALDAFLDATECRGLTTRDRAFDAAFSALPRGSRASTHDLRAVLDAACRVFECEMGD